MGRNMSEGCFGNDPIDQWLLRQVNREIDEMDEDAKQKRKDKYVEYMLAQREERQLGY
jgi:hypothetical protein